MSASFEPFNLTLNIPVNSFCAVSSIKARTVSNASLGESNGNSGKASFHNMPIVLRYCGCGLSVHAWVMGGRGSGGGAAPRSSRCRERK